MDQKPPMITEDRPNFREETDLIFFCMGAAFLCIPTLIGALLTIICLLASVPAIWALLPLAFFAAFGGFILFYISRPDGYFFGPKNGIFRHFPTPKWRLAPVVLDDKDVPGRAGTAGKT